MLRERYKDLAMQFHPDRGGNAERFKAVSKAYALLSSSERRADYDANGLSSFDEEEAELAELSEWMHIKMPFTAFKDRRFFRDGQAERIGTMYILLADETPGPFTMEMQHVKAGRCENAYLLSAGFYGSARCEVGHCDCGYYNGLRVEGFEGPLKPDANGRVEIRGRLEYGHADNHSYQKAINSGWAHLSVYATHDSNADRPPSFFR